MLRMGQLLPVFRHGRNALLLVMPMPATAPQNPPLGSAAPFRGQDYPAGGAGGAGTGGGGGAAAAAGFIAEVIIGITTPLSRSMAWPAPSCCAALLSSLKMPPPPPELAAGMAPSPRPGSPPR